MALSPTFSAHVDATSIDEARLPPDYLGGRGSARAAHVHARALVGPGELAVFKALIVNCIGSFRVQFNFRGIQTSGGI